MMRSQEDIKDLFKERIDQVVKEQRDKPYEEKKSSGLEKFAKFIGSIMIISVLIGLLQILLEVLS